MLTEQQEAAMRQAREALKEDRAWLESDAPKEVWGKNNDAITALTAALEQPAQQEPVGRISANCEGILRQEVMLYTDEPLRIGTAVYTRPQAPEPVIDKSAAIRIATALGWEPKREPLTDEEIEQCMKQAYATVQGRNLEHAFARAIEAAHGITGEKK